MRSQIPTESPAREAIDKATRIDHAVEGLRFEGYNIPCDEDQARIIFETAKQYCLEIVRDIEKALRLAPKRLTNRRRRRGEKLQLFDDEYHEPERSDVEVRQVRVASRLSSGAD